MIWNLIRQILALLAPWKNETTAQKVVTAMEVVLVVVGAVVALAPPAWQPPVASPDVPTVPDVPAVQPESPDVPEVSPPVSQGWGFSFGLGCSSAQIAKWQAFGEEVGACLARTCSLAQDTIGILQGGGWVELLTDAGACAVTCLSAGINGTLATAKGEARATYYGTSTETAPTIRLRVVRPVAP